MTSISLTIRNILRGIRLIHKTQPMHLELYSITNVIYAILPLLLLFLSSRIITELAGERDTNRIFLYASLAIGAGFVMQAVRFIIYHVMTVKGFDLFHSRYTRFEGMKFAEMDYEYVDDARIHQLREDINMRRGANMGLDRLFVMPEFMGDIVRLAAATLLLSGMFVANPDGTLINSPWIIILLLVATIVIPAAINTLLNGRINLLMETITASRSKANAAARHYNNSFLFGSNGGKDVRIFGIANSIMAHVTRAMSWHRGKWTRAQCRTSAVTSAIGMFFSTLAYMVIGLRAIVGMYTIGEVTLYVGAIATFSGAVVSIVNTLSDLHQNTPYLSQLYQYLDTPSSKYVGSLTTEKRSDNDYELEFKNVSFKYPATDVYALKNINLKLTVGKRLAVVGRNGSGKTTLIKLLCRLYEPTEGEITLNGVDIRKYMLHDYTKIFSVVFQDFSILHLPLGENVAISTEYNEEAVIAALEKTGFGTRLAELEKGLGTPLYKGSDHEGVLISGGEAQKIALARALYKNAPFVILDEPTSALDPLAEYEIYTKFDQIVENRTAIYISHRLSSCRFCDSIAVFEDGKMVQLGEHEKLLAETSGTYHRLWNAQALHYEAE